MQMIIVYMLSTQVRQGGVSDYLCVVDVLMQRLHFWSCNSQEGNAISLTRELRKRKKETDTIRRYVQKQPSSYCTYAMTGFTSSICTPVIMNISHRSELNIQPDLPSCLLMLASILAVQFKQPSWPSSSSLTWMRKLEQQLE